MPRVATFIVAFLIACGMVAPAGRAQTLGDSLRRRSVKELAAGRFLIAARGMADPNFARTVVLLVEFNAEGAAGFIVNRTASVSVGRLFPRFAESPTGAVMAFAGGPVVSPGSVAALARSAGGDARRVLDGVFLLRTRESLERAIADGAGSNRLRVYVGYAGWGAGQLEDETATGAWKIVDGDANVVFDARPDDVWPRLIARTEALSADGHYNKPGAMTFRAARCTVASSGP